MSFNINDYTVEELMTIFLIDTLTEKKIKDKINYVYNLAKTQGNEELINFTKLSMKKLLNEIGITELESVPIISTSSSSSSSSIPEKPDKPAPSESFLIENVKDYINPTLKNTMQRILHIDSQFRSSTDCIIGTNTTASNFTFDISDEIKNVLNMKMISIQLPYSWYVFDQTYGNTYFWVYNQDKFFQITITSGNYTYTTFVAELVRAFIEVGFTNITVDDNISVSQITGKITINLNGVIDPNNEVIVGIESKLSDNISAARIIFYDFSESLKSLDENNSTTLYYNSTIGWRMGFRRASTPILINGNTGEETIYLYGTKYILIVLDDLNQNHVNSSLITLSEASKKIELPKYFTKDIEYAYTCATPRRLSIIQNSINNPDGSNIDVIKELFFNSSSQLLNGCLDVMLDKIDNNVNENINLVYNCFPKVLTQSQVYTINEINKNNSRQLSYKRFPPASGDTFAIIPININQRVNGEIFTEMGSYLQLNKRTYFGPVDISRMRLKLTDDMGNILNLNGQDWNMTLIVETLYQY